MSKCIILSRVSTGHQDLDQQTKKVKEFALRDGYIEQNIISIEDVESAVKLSEEERNGLNKMKDYIIKNPEIDCVYTYEISRISRQAKIVFSIRDFLIEHHIQLVILNPLCKMFKDDGTLSETSNIFFGIFASLAENEGYIRKARIAKAREKYKSMGLHYGGNYMLGYTVNKNNEFVIDEERAQIVRDIFDMYVISRMSIRQIARELCDRGVQMWTCKTERKPTSYLTMCCNVNNILHRTEYIGEVKGKPQIISKEIYNMAQEIMKNRVISGYKKEVKALLKGMLKDEDSKFLLSANPASKYYYSKRCKGANISWAAADKVIIEWCNKQMKEWTEEENKKMIEDIFKQIQINRKKYDQCSRRAKEIRESLDVLEERIVLGKIRAEVAEKLENKLNEELVIIEENKDKYYNESVNLNNTIKRLKYNYYKEICDEMNIDEKINIVKKIIEVIYIKRESRTISTLRICTKIGTEVLLKVDTYHKCIIQ